MFDPAQSFCHLLSKSTLDFGQKKGKLQLAAASLGFKPSSSKTRLHTIVCIVVSCDWYSRVYETTSPMYDFEIDVDNKQIGRHMPPTCVDRDL